MALLRLDMASMKHIKDKVMQQKPYLGSVRIFEKKLSQSDGPRYSSDPPEIRGVLRGSFAQNPSTTVMIEECLLRISLLFEKTGAIMSAA